MRKTATGRWLKAWFLFFGVTFPMLLSGCGSNDSLPTWNITGSSFIYHTTNGTPGEQGPDLFVFTQAGGSLSGTTPLNQPITGSVSESTVTFSWVGSDGATYDYNGEIETNGTTMSGTWTSTNGQSGTWHAIVNASPAVDITGNWNTFHTTNGTPGEQGPDLFVFTQSGNGISGTAIQGSQLKGTISSLTITFSWVGSDGATYIYTGTVSGGTTMSGTWTATNGQAGTWRATKGS